MSHGTGLTRSPERAGDMAGRATVLALVVVLASYGCKRDEPMGTDSGFRLPACSDAFDNDFDALVDYPADPGCADAEDDDENDPPVPPGCADGLDNDGDGLIDFPEDPGCVAASDMSEDEIRQCNDDVDNDGDGLTDFPFDPGCQAPGDDDETDPPAEACRNGADDDGDMLTDFPDDPGCLNETDQDETDPDPLPVCGNGLDDDGDGLTDFPADPGCFAASDPSEIDAVIGPCGTTVEAFPLPADADVVGSFFGGSNQFAGSCGGLGGEVIYQLTVTQAGNFRITTNHPATTMDTVVHIRSDCMDSMSELGCNDETDPVGEPGNHASTVLLTAVPPGDYYIFVDAFAPGSTGVFRLTVDRIIALGDTCDAADPLQICEQGLVCRELTMGAGSTCELPICGDMMDNDADGATDYPDDPGCLGTFDPYEEDPLVLPECANGIDDDGDSLIDYPMDTGCDAASDPIESQACGASGAGLLDLDAGGSAVGDDTDLMTNDFSPTCGGSGGNDLVFAFYLGGDVSSLSVRTDPETNMPMVVALQSVCDDTSSTVSCNAAFFGAGPSFTTGPLTAGTYYLFVDQSLTGAMGSWGMHLSADLQMGASCDPFHQWQLCTAGSICANDAPGPDFTCRVSACADGLDNDLPTDGLTDYPNDPGCADVSDDDETDPTTTPACFDGVDNDGDGRMDFPGDPGCAATSDNDEDNECGPTLVPTEITNPVVTLAGMEHVFTGATTAGSASRFAGSCGGGAAPEAVYMIEVTAPATQLHAFTTMPTNPTIFDDTILYIRSGHCELGAEEACNNNSAGLYSDVVVTPVPAGFYFIVVDGASAFDIGDHELHVELTP